MVIGHARSPFAPAHKGALAQVRPDDMMAQVLAGLVARVGVAPAEIEDVALGCAFPEGEQGLNLARLAGLLAGFPDSVGGITLNRFCGSSLSAVHYVAGQIALGAGGLFVAGGVESMSRVPMTGFNPSPNPALAARSAAYIGMGETAENVARAYGISRRAQEAFALESQRRAARAQGAGVLAAEIVPIASPQGVVAVDGCLRPQVSARALAGLRPAFAPDGSVTAGTSAPLTDGASALLLAQEGEARRRGWPMLARVVSVAVAGCAPELMGMGPVAASRKALARAGIGAEALDLVELNEAFAAQALACMAQLGLDGARVNLEGGALALGHPLGASGARIVGKAASLLARGQGRYALATQCIGGGQGIAVVLERVAQ